jgi:glycine cleavage system H protein
MSKTYFTSEHEWIKVEGDVGTVGITDHAQGALGDVVFVELPAVGKTVTKGGDAAVVESVKAASDVYSPVSGEVVGANDAIIDQPGLVNESAEDGAWFFKVKLSNPSELEGLMDRTAYDAFAAGQH